MTTLSQEKSQLRRRFREERAQRCAELGNARNAGGADFLHLLNQPEIQAATVVTSYLSIRDEPSTAELNQALIKAGKTLLLPRVTHPDLEWVAWNGDRANLQEKRGLLEPLGESILELSLIDAVIVPALQIDLLGYRMGQGGGYYDRALPMMTGWKVGIVYEEELTNTALPIAGHDVALNAAATPFRLIRFS